MSKSTKSGYGSGGVAADVGAVSSDASKSKVVNRGKQPTRAGAPGDFTQFGASGARGSHPDASRRVKLIAPLEGIPPLRACQDEDAGPGMGGAATQASASKTGSPPTSKGGAS